MPIPVGKAEDSDGARDFDLFMSYRRKDSRSVMQLADALVASGIRVWIDQREIADFDSITDDIRRGIARSKALLAWYSAEYPKSRPCQQELTAAFIAAQRLGDPRRRVLVVNPEADAAHVTPIQLADQQHAPDTDPSVLAARIAAVVQHLEGQLGAGSATLPPQYGHKLTGSSRFVGRLRDLWAIHSGLFARESSIISSNESPGIVQVTGLGGIGKSLLAEEYALRFASAFPAGIFWLRAAAFEAHQTHSDPGEVEARRREQFRAIALALGINTVGLEHDRVEAELASALKKSTDTFLWIVDDLGPDLSAEAFRRWLAPSPNGCTLITTRSREYAGIGTVIPLAVLTAMEALSLLTARRSVSTPDEKTAAEGLCDDLGFHPLAVDVTGSALVSWPETIAEFRRVLAKPSKDELDLSAELADALPNGHEKSIAATLLRSIRALSRRDRISSGLRRVWPHYRFRLHSYKTLFESWKTSEGMRPGGPPSGSRSAPRLRFRKERRMRHGAFMSCWREPCVCTTWIPSGRWQFMKRQCKHSRASFRLWPTCGSMRDWRSRFPMPGPLLPSWRAGRAVPNCQVGWLASMSNAANTHLRKRNLAFSLRPTRLSSGNETHGRCWRPVTSHGR